MCRHHVAALGQDQIGILGDLELFVAIMLGEPHAGADDFQDIEDLERPIALVCAELAVIRMIDRDQRIDPGRARRLKLGKLQLALVLGQHGEVDALQAHGRLVQVDEIDAGDCAQDVGCSLHHAGHTGMLVQREPHRHAAAQERLEIIETGAQEAHERRDVERPGAALPFECRQGRLGHLHVAAWAPAQHLAGFAVRQFLDRARSHAA